MRGRCHLALSFIALASCASARPRYGGLEGTIGLPVGATVGPAGFATILTAPPRAYPDDPPRPVPHGKGPAAPIARALGMSLEDARDRVNPDEASRQAAKALEQRLRMSAKGNFVDVVIERDPLPHFIFYFRRDAAATLARFTSDPRFRSRDRGVPEGELQPIFDAWWKRFQPDRLAGGGAVYANEGVVRFDMNVDEAEFRTITAREHWTLPKRLELRFAPPRNPRSVDPALVHFVRIFAREDRRPAIIRQAALGGRIILRDGCFRVANSGQAGEPLVLFGGDSELAIDADGYMVVRQPRAEPGRGSYRVGEMATWGGPRAADDADTGIQALHARCGSGPVVNVGEPDSAYAFRVRTFAIDNYATTKGITRQAAYDRIKACFAEDDTRAAEPGAIRSTPRECDSAYPDNPPPPVDEARRKRAARGY